MATTRLRKAFRYPADEDSDDPVEGIDEEEQEKLIQTLHTTDAAKTRLYTTLLLLLPLLPTLLYLPLLSSSLPSFLSAAAAISSLLATAYTLYYVPLAPSESERAEKPSLGRLGVAGDEAGPVQRYIVPLNGALSGMLAIREMLAGTGWREGLSGGGGYVPAFVFLLILVARTQLRPVDVGELEKLRYRYKGA